VVGRFLLMTDAAVLSVAHATKRFGARAALDDVSLSVNRGEMVALIGPSGSGKSTLLRALTGLTVLDAGPGRIEAFGDTVQADGKVSDKIRTIRRRIGFIFQQFNLVRRLTLYQNVVMGSLGRLSAVAGTLGIWPAETKLAAMAALARVGVADHAGQKAATLSGGQQQRGAIARALVQKACDRIVALSAGKVVYDGPPTGLDRARLIDIYGPEFEDVAHEGLK
jgi:phosphonate transport system ATP-binding protein